MKVLRGLTQENIRQSKLRKAICLLIFIAMVSLTGATPVSAQSMEGMGSNHSRPDQENASVPLCCLTADCPLYHSVAVKALPCPDSFTLMKVVKLVSLPANLIPESSSDQQRPSQRDTLLGFLGPPGSEYYCRNRLKSEEPPQV